MSIKGLTDSNSINPAYRMIGKLRKGAEKISTTKPGEELPHWRFTSDVPEIEQAFVEAYGADPVDLEVYIPHANPDAAFPTWCEIWEPLAWCTGVMVLPCRSGWRVITMCEVRNLVMVVTVKANQ